MANLKRAIHSFSYYLHMGGELMQDVLKWILNISDNLVQGKIDFPQKAAVTAMSAMF